MNKLAMIEIDQQLHLMIPYTEEQIRHKTTYTKL